MKLFICTKFHVNRMNCAESRRGGGGGVAHLPFKSSCNYFFFADSNLRFALIKALHLGFDHVEPRPAVIFVKLVFCHGPSFSIPPRRISIRCNIHEVSLLSRPFILKFITQNLDQVQYLRKDGGFVTKAKSR